MKQFTTRTSLFLISLVMSAAQWACSGADGEGTEKSESPSSDDSDVEGDDAEASGDDSGGSETDADETDADDSDDAETDDSDPPSTCDGARLGSGCTEDPQEDPEDPSEEPPCEVDKTGKIIAPDDPCSPEPDCPEAEAGDDVVCVQVVTSAENPETGTCCAYPTPCHVPEGWKECDVTGSAGR